MNPFDDDGYLISRTVEYRTASPPTTTRSTRMPALTALAHNSSPLSVIDLTFRHSKGLVEFHYSTYLRCLLPLLFLLLQY